MTLSVSQEGDALPCFCCGASLDNIDRRGNQPFAGLEFTSPGAYGCSVFDPMNGTLLVLNICDQCLIKNQERARVAEPITPVKVAFYKYEPFEPGKVHTDGDN